MSSPAIDLEIREYSEKAFAVFGDTKTYSKEFTNHGTFNLRLKYINSQGNEERKPGWIFSKFKKAVIEKLIKDIKEGKVSKSTEQSAPSSLTDIDLRKIVANLSSRIERLEQEMALLSPINRGLLSDPTGDVANKKDDESDDEDEPITERPRLLKK